jgi:glycosyltransferase involved in cell wall biosynthesis
MMKIVAVLEASAGAGGGFNQGLSAIQQMDRICRNRFEFSVLTTCPESVGYLEQLGIASHTAKVGLMDTLLIQGAQSPAWRTFQRRARYLGPLERRLLGIGCDLAYFVSPSPLPAALQRLNFIATVWDLCHREFPEFPEVRSFGEIQARERMLHSVLSAAYAVVSDSENLADKIDRLYGIDRHRVIPMPFSPAPLMRADARSDPSPVLRKHDLKPGYFFYPAQFWAHKNHDRILQAAKLLQQQGVEIDVAFSGGDGGELSRLRTRVKELHLEHKIRFLGFVPYGDMGSLYEGCRAVIMPTYFGPTNLPPLEAWAAKRPLVYSKHLHDQVGDAAILVDPDEAESLAAGMRQCFDDKAVERLVHRGCARLEKIEAARRNAESLLAEALERFSRRMQAWS